MDMKVKIPGVVDVEMKVPAIEKLVDYTASGIGSIAGSMLAPWIARREAQAKQIAAKGEVEEQKILAEGQAHKMRTIANAQADARAILVSPDSIIQGELDIAQTVTQRIQFQEEKRQRNIGTVVGHAALELGDKDVSNSEPDHDWTARFFNDVQDVSSEEMQSLWGKVLAGEVERPRSTSILTLSILRNLDQATAGIFRKLCSTCVSIRPDGNQFIDARVPSLGGNPGKNVLKDYGLNFDALNVLNQHGLIISDYNSWYDYRVCIGIASPDPEPRLIRLPFSFQGRYWVLESTTVRTENQEFRLSGVALTRSGRELSRIVDLEPMNKYAQALMEFFKTKNLKMTEVDDWQPQSFKTDTRR